MEQCLRALAAGGGPGAFAVTYDDMHGLWGGVTITLAGDGSYERAERRMGAPAPTVTRGSVGAEQVRAVAALLLQIAPWEQRSPLTDRMPVPDESWGTLTTTCAGRVARIAERHHELRSLQRISRVRDLLDELSRPQAPRPPDR